MMIEHKPENKNRDSLVIYTTTLGYNNLMSLNYLKIYVPFLDDLSSAAKTEQLARAPAPATHATYTATPSGGARGEYARSDMASAVRDRVGSNDSRTPRQPRSQSLVPYFFLFSMNHRRNSHTRRTCAGANQYVQV